MDQPLVENLVQHLKALQSVVSLRQVVEATVWKLVSCVTSKDGIPFTLSKGQ